jgi:fructan beta-fructosidase
MSIRNKIFTPVLLGILLSYHVQGQSVQTKTEKYRPQIHFTPQAHWMNDPNGMVYYKGKYHLFYQHFPGGNKWGPMHWGHATSADLVHWEHLPIALYPDSLGYIFSGSAVVDEQNTSGFGKDGKVPLVAIFTHHDPKGEKAGRNDFQNQSLAYSLDEGKSWTKYAGNPVLRNPGIVDFRDPKVMWYEAGKKWIMTLATKDRITFYASPNLKEWTKESEFGAQEGGHGGVWECPDLFPLKLEGKTYWVLIVNINPGAPNGGSGGQYFIGDFDGKHFTPVDNKTRWLDYGTDDYAGITWSNTGERKIFMGWMNNWTYANEVPTPSWRGAATLPRELKLEKVNGEVLLKTLPVKELDNIDLKSVSQFNIEVKDRLKLVKGPALKSPFKLELQGDQLKNFTLSFENKLGDKLIIGYNEKTNNYFIDRSKSGDISFNQEFKKLHTAPRIGNGKKMNLIVYVDVASVEFFADGGLTVMTDVFFPQKPMDQVYFKPGASNAAGYILKKLKYTPLKSTL